MQKYIQLIVEMFIKRNYFIKNLFIIFQLHTCPPLSDVFLKTHKLISHITGHFPHMPTIEKSQIHIQ